MFRNLTYTTYGWLFKLLKKFNVAHAKFINGRKRV